MFLFCEIIEHRSQFQGREKLRIDFELFFNILNWLQMWQYLFIGSFSDLPVDMFDSEGHNFQVVFILCVIHWCLNLNIKFIVIDEELGEQGDNIPDNNQSNSAFEWGTQKQNFEEAVGWEYRANWFGTICEGS